MEQLKEETRKEEIVFVRQLIMYFGKTMKVGTFAYIAGIFGLDHATAVHSVRTINNYIDTDRLKRQKVEEYAKKFEKIKEFTAKKIELEKILRPLEKEASTLERRLINIQICLKSVIDSINKLYQQEA